MLKTKDDRRLNVEELTWDQVHGILHKALPAFSKIMESYNNDNYKFYKASYPFGSKIINGGKCYLPLADGDSIEFNDPMLPESLAHNLNYNHVTEDPLGLVLSKNSEFYLQTGDRVMSHAIIHPGEMFGIPRAIEQTNSRNKPSNSSLSWNLNSGARFLFTLSKVTAKNRHEKLQKAYKIKVQVPLSAEEQWPIFAEIAKQAKSEWQSEILYFPRAWINQLKEESWAPASNYLMQLHRSSYNIWHNTALIWAAAFNEIEQQKRLTHYSVYALFTARQLFLIAANSAIGFRPATTDDSAPIKLFQEAYGNSYGLNEDNHSNVIMEPSNLTPTSDAIYYSLNCPMLAQYNPETFKGKSLITLLDEVQRITSIYQENILSNHSNIRSLYDVASSTKFVFYHCHSDQKTYKHILNNLLIAKEDPRFTKNQSGEFPEYSSFFKGCIKISRK